MKIRQIGQKVIPNKESHQNEIIKDSFHVVREAKSTVNLQLLELQLEILANNTQMHQVEILVFQLLGLFGALPAEGDLFSKKAEMWIVTEQAQHDEVGIQAV